MAGGSEWFGRATKNEQFVSLAFMLHAALRHGLALLVEGKGVKGCLTGSRKRGCGCHTGNQPEVVLALGRAGDTGTRGFSFWPAGGKYSWHFRKPFPTPSCSESAFIYFFFIIGIIGMYLYTTPGICAVRNRTQACVHPEQALR